MTLNNEQEAIKQAVEAGYSLKKQNERIESGPIGMEQIFEVSISATMQDPDFWIALGKARGWKNVYRNTDLYSGTWMYYALLYFEIKLRGYDLNQFWNTLP